MTGRRPRDTIELLGLQTTGICGTLPEEQIRPQPIEIDAEIEVDLSRPGRTDDIQDTVDYSALAAEIERVVSTERFFLLERLAQRLCDVLLTDERVVAVTVGVRKLRPPVAQQLRTAGVRMVRERP